MINAPRPLTAVHRCLSRSAGPSSSSRSPWAPLLGAILLVSGLTAGTLPNAAEASEVSPSLEAGVYVYGEAPTPGQPGVTYLVMQVQGQQVVGGFYQPQSSFDCFRGQIVGQTLALRITDSYHQTTYPYQLGLDQPTLLAAPTGASPRAIPQGFYPLETLSPTDQQVLATCQTQS